MNIEAHRITVGGLTVEVVRKDIKNLHLGIYPPNGRVRVRVAATAGGQRRGGAASAVIGKLDWIKRQQAKFVDQPRQSQREMVNGESHYFFGAALPFASPGVPGPTPHPLQWR